MGEDLSDWKCKLCSRGVEHMLSYLADVAGTITSELWEAQNDAYETGDVAPLVDELASANPPWSVLSDKFSILQDELVRAPQLRVYVKVLCRSTRYLL